MISPAKADNAMNKAVASQSQATAAQQARTDGSARGSSRKPTHQAAHMPALARSTPESAWPISVKASGA